MREDGYYWIRLKRGNGEAEIAEWAEHVGWWYRTGSGIPVFQGEELEVLSERLLPPDWDKGPPLKSEA